MPGPTVVVATIRVARLSNLLVLTAALNAAQHPCYPIAAHSKNGVRTFSQRSKKDATK